MTPPIQVAFKLAPSELADLLDRWALRREKVLYLLDLPAAQAARALARRCRALAFEAESGGWLCGNAVALEWLEIREAVVHLLEHGAERKPKIAS